MYESTQEILIIMPLGGVKKDTLSLKIEDYKLSVTGERTLPEVKENLVSEKNVIGENFIRLLIYLHRSTLTRFTANSLLKIYSRSLSLKLSFQRRSL